MFLFSFSCLEISAKLIPTSLSQLIITGFDNGSVQSKWQAIILASMS